MRFLYKAYQCEITQLLGTSVGALPNDLESCDFLRDSLTWVICTKAFRLKNLSHTPPFSCSEFNKIRDFSSVQTCVST